MLSEQLIEYLPFAAALLGALAFWLVSRRGPREDETAEEPDDRIDLAVLPQTMPSGGPRLELYGVEVRMAAVVVAPAGRAETLSPEQALEVVGQLAPRLGEVALLHKPRWMCWPSQLSAQGFRTTFANRVSLPGERGKGTRWCTASGKVTLADRQWLVGIVLCAEAPNPLGEIEVDHEGRWPDVLRVRADAS